MTREQIATVMKEGGEIGFALLCPRARTIRVAAVLTPPRRGWLSWLAGKSGNVDELIPHFPDLPAGSRGFRWE